MEATCGLKIHVVRGNRIGKQRAVAVIKRELSARLDEIKIWIPDFTPKWTHGVFEDTLWFSGVGAGWGQGTLSVSDTLITVDGNVEIPLIVSLVLGDEKQMNRRVNEVLDSLGL